MPIYEYECMGCKTHHEVMQKITDSPLEKCPDCGGLMKKKISNTSFVLKGTGWYATDYAGGNKKGEPCLKPEGKKTPVEGVEKTSPTPCAASCSKADSGECKTPATKDAAAS